MGSGTPSVSATNLKLAWRNLGRNPRRTLLAWAGIAVAQITLVWLSSFMNGYESLIFEKLTGPMLGHVQVHAPRYRDDSAIERTIPGATEVIHKIEQQPHVANVSPRVYGPVLATAQELGHVAMVTGLDLPGETGASGLIEGMPRDQLPGPQECLIGKSLAAEMMVHPGDTLALMGQAVDGSVASGLYKVKGIVESDVEQINRAGILLNMAAAQELLAMNDQVHELAIHVDRPENIPGVLAALRKSPDLSRFEILDWKELVPQLSAFLQISGVDQPDHPGAYFPDHHLRDCEHDADGDFRAQSRVWNVDGSWVQTRAFNSHSPSGIRSTGFVGSAHRLGNRRVDCHGGNASWDLRLWRQRCFDITGRVEPGI